jgi:hypothetical protein
VVLACTTSFLSYFAIKDKLKAAPGVALPPITHLMRPIEPKDWFIEHPTPILAIKFTGVPTVAAETDCVIW